MKLLCFFFFLITFFGCKNNDHLFINYNKWKIPDALGNNYLRSMPQEIKESSYEVLDTTIEREGMKIDASVYAFDGEGNMKSGSLLVDSFIYSEFLYKYDDNGEQFEYRSYRSPQKDSLLNESKNISRKMEDNKYLITSLRNNEKKYEELQSFGGDSVLIERMEGGKVKFRKILFYKNNRLRKVVQEDAIVSHTQSYYRNDKGFLDSIVYSVKDNGKGERVVRRDFFTNNDKGDPIFYYSIEGADTVSFERNSYRYDSKNNWVRNLRYSHSKNSPPYLGERKFPDYQIIIRQIKY